jgi:AcrR family transcriptional regulator
MGRPRKHDEATARALLDAGEELLIEGGISAVSVRAVADRAGTTTRAVYALFRSKDGLIEAIAANGYLLLAGLVNVIPRTQHPRSDLVAVGGAFRTFAIGHPSLFRLTFERAQAEVFSTETVVSAAVKAHEALLALIERAQDAGVVDPDRNPNAIAFMIHAACQGLAGSELAAQPPPVGAGMWKQSLRDYDRTEAWDLVLSAIVDRLSP